MTQQTLDPNVGNEWQHKREQAFQNLLDKRQKSTKDTKPIESSSRQKRAIHGE